MSKKPKISCLMSVYKTDIFWLKAAISSILLQSLTDFELLVILDDPKDETLFSFLLSVEASDSRVKIFRNDKNLGLTKSLNILLEKATGKYVARMDSDDISRFDRFEEQYKILEKEEDVFLVASSINYIDSNGLKICYKNKKYSSEFLSKKLPTSNLLVHPTIFFRNSNFRYREAFIYSQDYDFYLRLIDAGKKLLSVSTPLLSFRLSHKSISSKKRREQLMFALAAKDLYKKPLINITEPKSFIDEKPISFKVLFLYKLIKKRIYYFLKIYKYL